MSNTAIATALTAKYTLPSRTFGLAESKIGTNEHIFRRLVTNIIVGGTLEENAIAATIAIFKKYPHCEALAWAKLPVLTHILQINSVRFAERKAGYLIDTANVITEKYDGVVPNNRVQLEKFKGVGRHVASIVLALGFEKPALAVDLHVKRIAKRLGLVNECDTDRAIEQKLMQGIEPKLYARYSRAFVDFGKEICAKTPNCSACFLQEQCGKVGEVKLTVTADAVQTGDGVYEIVAGSSALPYNVTVKNGQASCNCKGYRFRKTCSHVKEVTQ